MWSGSWNKHDIPDLSNRTIIVTGANSGIGFAATKSFVANGATVIMACRNEDRAATAKDEILTDVPTASLPIHQLDLADISSIRAFTDTITTRYDELHVLCNNAGVMGIPRQETQDGFEKQFGVNHLGHFALTALLFEQLTDTPEESRVVTHSSQVHERGRIDFTDINSEQSYNKWDAYAQSKLANVLFAYELHRRLSKESTNVTSVACHPGYAATKLQELGPRMEGQTARLWIVRVANFLLAQSASRGALPLLYAATHQEISGGEYIGPIGLLNLRGSPAPQSSSDRSYDIDTARELWAVSEELTGVSFDLLEP
jgi:NAD(P)-dependent dehydrogenase (short-subunit alcohol dehydrogenase family)